MFQLSAYFDTNSSKRRSCVR